MGSGHGIFWTRSLQNRQGGPERESLSAEFKTLTQRTTDGETRSRTCAVLKVFRTCSCFGS